MEKKVHGRPQTAGANSHRGATKKREMSRTLFSINIHFLVEFSDPISRCSFCRAEAKRRRHGIESPFTLIHPPILSPSPPPTCSYQN